MAAEAAQVVAAQVESRALPSVAPTTARGPPGEVGGVRPPGYTSYLLSTSTCYLQGELRSTVRGIYVCGPFHGRPSGAGRVIVNQSRVWGLSMLKCSLLSPRLPALKLSQADCFCHHTTIPRLPTASEVVFYRPRSD